MKKKTIYMAFISVILMLAFSCTVFASSYTTTVQFKVARQGATRSFNGNDIKYSATTTVSFVHATNDKYTVELYRKRFIGADYIGKKTLDRQGYNSCKWSNVGSGNYYLYFSKANDNVVITSNDVVIKN